MSLFQTSVVKKYLNDLSPELIDKKYKVFNEYFGNLQIQENIRSLKEEEFQEGFIRELFVTILDYTLKPNANFNIELEKKNIDDSKKADGAILKGGVVIAVIELKSTQTIDLTTVETQAFGYKNHNPKCQYIITSNFEKIRIYIQNAIDHIEFDLFKLTKEDFALLWLCFSKDNILNDVPLKIKEASVLQEENVTKKLYHDYSKFREDIFSNIVKTNPEFDKLVLFKKTQKLLDRFLFIFFAEDRLLLPPNSISDILKQWKTLKEELDEYIPLYDRFKKYFGYLNTGHKGKQHEIFAYNGGLFTPDEILDNIKIDDELLYKHTQQLSTYNYESEVDVNILGHIFEHSLGEIEHVQAEIAGEVVDTQKTKRKKDGIFYTPKYITKYIVENTVGKLCEEKRTELGVIDEEYAKGRKNRKKEIVLDLDKKLADYRNWLLGITILDPACGSGAFLNQALEFLIQEHKKIDELKAQLLGGSIVFSDIEAKILEKNIYGVDLNEESVDIAKLSLWLRTAQKGRKLTTLSNHIKCGNSLIDDPEVVGEKAFNWQKEFPEVFIKGGFDVVIGNPPYVQLQNMKELSLKIKNLGYRTYESTGDLYCLFYEKGNDILKPEGLLGFITSNKWMRSNYGKSMRKYFVENTNPFMLIDLGASIFESAVVDSNIIFFQKKKVQNLSIFALDLIKEKNVRDFSAFQDNFIEINPKGDEIWTINNPIEKNIKKKIDAVGIPLKDWNIKINFGIKTGYNEAFIIDELTKNKIIKEDPKSAEIIKPILRGRDVQRYYPEYANLWLIATLPSLSINIDDYQGIKNHLLSFGKRIEQSGEKGCRKKTNNKWFETQDAIAFYKEFEKELIIWKRIGSIIRFSMGKFYSLDSTCILSSDHNKYLLCVLNSKMGHYLLKDSPKTGTGDLLISVQAIEPIKIPLIFNEQLFIKMADQMLEFTKEYQEINQKFHRTIKRKFALEELSNKLQNWYLLSFTDFISELSKKKIKLTLTEEAEWESYFLQEAKKALELKAKIEKTDKEIDQMVYKLYDLTEEEIKIIICQN